MSDRKDKARLAHSAPGCSTSCDVAEAPTRRPIDEYVGARLRGLREASGMDLTEISAAVAISEEVITQYEFGEQRPSPGDLVALVRLFGVNLRELFPHPIAPTSRQIH